MRIIKPRISAKTLALIIKSLSVLLILFTIFMLFQINAQGRQIAQRANDIATQSHQIAIDNQKHIDCIADLFARYTRDNKPITIKDLDTCRATYGSVRSNTTSQSSAAEPQKDLANNNSTLQTNQTTTKNKDSQANKDTNPAPQPSPVRILGVPLCVPFTGACVRH